MDEREKFFHLARYALAGAIIVYAAMFVVSVVIAVLILVHFQVL